MKKRFYLVLVLAVAAAAALRPANAFAKTARELETSVDVSLDRLVEDVPGAKSLLSEAKGVLVFPSVLKGGIVLGAEYGEGALRVNGKTAAYYNIIAGSLGFQWGAQARRVYILFMDQKALDDFLYGSGWSGGLNASAAVVTVGAEGSIDSIKMNQPVITFVLDQKGLMVDLNIGAAKFNKISKA